MMIPSWIRVLAGISLCAGLFVWCTNGKKSDAIVNANGDVYVGSAACASCHRGIADSFMHTAHAFASRPADREFIKGSFAVGSNEFSFNDYSRLPVSVKVVMEERDSGLYQTAYIGGVAKRSERFGVVIGSGRKAQSYLFWRGDQLLQLPVSYFSATNSWANSPGFPPDQIKFNRLIPAHCLECHSTVCTLKPTTETIPGPNPPAFFDRKKMLYGVGCEACHGPGARHVEYETARASGAGTRGTEDRETVYAAAHYIVNPGKLARERGLDVCANCHSGIRTSLRPPFSFVAGDTLDRYFGPGPATDTTNAEVHGNQYGLLAASKCFMGSGLSCNTCHNTHVNQQGQLAAYSAACMRCHTAGGGNGAMAGRDGVAGASGGTGGAHFCSRKPMAGEDITKNCIDCHMPVRASNLVTLMVPGQKQLAPLLVRSHLIAIYTKK